MNRLQNVINFLAILFLAIWTNCLNAIFLLGPEGISLLFVGIYSIVLIIIALGIGFALHKKKMVNLSGKEID